MTTEMTPTTSRPIEEDPRWAAVCDRDARFDGRFVYSVRSTGVYCRPSCAARRAKPENVQFHATPVEAERAGFRPCKRCKPDQAGSPHAAVIAAVCRTIAEADEVPSLQQLAEVAGLSPSRLHRLFKAMTGITPKAYAVAHRTRRVQESLARGDGTVTQAIYDAGFNSSGRFYEQADRMLGMTPGQYRSGGMQSDISYAIGECWLGSILVALSDRGVCAILMGDQADALVGDLEQRFPKARLLAGGPAFEGALAQVIASVDDPAKGLDLPLDIRGTAFQQRVWQALRDIPAGATASYSEIAARLGMPTAIRAVASACAANRLAVAIPCHRAVRNDGSLSGYRWGVERKRALLKREKDS